VTLTAHPLFTHTAAHVSRHLYCSACYYAAKLHVTDIAGQPQHATQHALPVVLASVQNFELQHRHLMHIGLLENSPFIKIIPFHSVPAASHCNSCIKEGGSSKVQRHSSLHMHASPHEEAEGVSTGAYRLGLLKLAMSWHLPANRSLDKIAFVPRTMLLIPSHCSTFIY
jgi:hypothetical protein